MDVPGYELEELLGAGAMGAVWRARPDGPGGPVVALKCLTAADPGLRARARREADVLRALDHPHIVRVLDVVDDGTVVAVAMQYAPGGSLADRLAAQGRLAPAEVVAVAAPIADAVAAAHRQGVLHRDVKPANILFTADGEPLLSDFGVARWASAPGLTGAGQGCVGTAEYLDPAVAAGAPADQRSDVYALGVVCYEALTGRPPFTGDTALAVLRAADAGRPVPLAEVVPHVPAPLRQLVERAMARRPDDRPASAVELAAALRAAAGHPERRLGPARPGGEARPTRTFGPRPPRAAEAPRRRVPRAGVAALAAVLLLVPVVLVGLVRQTSAESVAEAGPAVLRVPGRAPAPPRCRATAPGPGAVSGDLDGDGCPSAVAWDGTVASVPAEPGRAGSRFQLGQPGDHLLLGDWDCDGRDTPALYRPATGEVFVFDRWADPGGEAVSRPAAGERTGGAARVVVGPDGCDRVVVEPVRQPV